MIDEPHVTPTDEPAEAAELAATRRWLERAVIGLNLCPFAKAVYVKRQVRFALSDAELEALFDLGYHTKHVDTIFRRVFG